MTRVRSGIAAALLLALAPALSRGAISVPRGRARPSATARAAVVEAATARVLARVGLPDLSSPLAAQKLRALAEAVPAADPSLPAVAAAAEAAARVEALEDLAVAAEALPEADRAAIGEATGQRLEQERARLQTLGARVAEAGLAAMADGRPEDWAGRTFLLKAPGGIAAFKELREDRGDDFEREGSLMELSRRLGNGMPAPLTGADGRFTTRLGGKDYLVYVVPEGAEGYFEYLGDSLGVPAAEALARIRAAALGVLDEIGRLRRAGIAQTSLAPLSHSDVQWAWDHFRFESPADHLGVFDPFGYHRGSPALRFGPSSIHALNAVLRHANARMSGVVADPGEFATREELGERWDSVVGQNLVEWSLLVLRASAVNGVPTEKAAELLTEGIMGLARAHLPEGAFSLDPRPLREAMRETAVRFYNHQRLDKRLWPFFKHAINETETYGDPAFNDPLSLAGGAIQRLAVGAVWPLTRALAGDDPRSPPLKRTEKLHSRTPAQRNDNYRSYYFMFGAASLGWYFLLALTATFLGGGVSWAPLLVLGGFFSLLGWLFGGAMPGVSSVFIFTGLGLLYMAATALIVAPLFPAALYWVNLLPIAYKLLLRQPYLFLKGRAEDRVAPWIRRAPPSSLP